MVLKKQVVSLMTFWQTYMPTSSLIIICLYNLVISGSFGENLALHKPAYQSSTIEVERVADRAVDGITSSTSVCSGTALGDTNPWWMVDMLGLYEITNVTMWDVNDSWPRNVTFEVSTKNPRLCSKPDMKLCTIYVGTKVLVDTVTCDLPVTGRFLKLSGGNEGGYLRFCEVDIRGKAVARDAVDCERTLFQRAEGKRYQVSGANSLVTKVSRLQCLIDCFKKHYLGFNYEISTQTCEMILKIESQNELVDSSGWAYYGEDIC